jgi:hypothetical protein
LVQQIGGRIWQLDDEDRKVDVRCLPRGDDAKLQLVWQPRIIRLLTNYQRDVLCNVRELGPYRARIASDCDEDPFEVVCHKLALGALTFDLRNRLGAMAELVGIDYRAEVLIVTLDDTMLYAAPACGAAGAPVRDEPKRRSTCREGRAAASCY